MNDPVHTYKAFYHLAKRIYRFRTEFPKAVFNLHVFPNFYQISVHFLMMFLVVFIYGVRADDAPSSIETGIEFSNTNGESCDSDDPWEYPCKYPLLCKNKLCTCPLALQIYVPEEESCYSAIGGICRDSAGANFTCVPGSTCSIKTRTCTCLPRHKGRKDGSACLPLKTHEESCTEQTDCDDFLNFECIHGKCGCDNVTKAYDPELKKCVVLSGLECDLSEPDDCTENSHCSHVSRTCVCNTDYSASKSGHCGRSFGASCGFNNLTCSDVFSCVDGQCKCPDPYNEHYDPERNQCVSLVSGYPCMTSDSFLPCVKNAECTFRGEWEVLECYCKPGYLEDDRFCREPFGASGPAI